MNKIARPIPPLLLMLFASATFAFSQSATITMKSGQSAAIQLKDTSGCYVTIFRNGSTARIAKKLIRQIVTSTDTIRLDSFVCMEAPQKPVRFSDSPEFAISNFLESCQLFQQKLEKNVPIAFMHGILQGSPLYPVDSVVFTKVESILGTDHSTMSISRASFVEKMNHPSKITQYVFLQRNYLETQNNFQREDGRVDLIGTFTNKIRELITVAEFDIVELSSKTIVFQCLAEDHQAMHDELQGSPLMLVKDYVPKEVKAEKAKEVMKELSQRSFISIMSQLEDNLHHLTADN